MQGSMILKTAAASLALIAAGSASASTSSTPLYFYNGGSEGDWNDGGNWFADPGDIPSTPADIVPGNGYKAVITSGEKVLVNVNATVDAIAVQGSGGYIKINGNFTLTIDGMDPRSNAIASTIVPAAGVRLTHSQADLAFPNAMTLSGGGNILITPGAGGATVLFSSTATLEDVSIHVEDAGLVSFTGNVVLSDEGLSYVWLNAESATVQVANSLTVSGDGYIQLADEDAYLRVADAKTLTSQVLITGFGKIAGPAGNGFGILSNQYEVQADDGALELNPDLNLGFSDSANKLWMTTSGGELVFEGSGTTSFAGNIKVAGGGTVKFMNNVNTSGTFIWENGSIHIPGDHDFTYTSFSSTCENPVGGRSPYVLSGPLEDPLTCTP